MDKQTERYIYALCKLVEYTQSGSIKWESTNQTDCIGCAFTTTIGVGKEYLIVRLKLYETLAGTSVLAVVNKDGQPTWFFPQLMSLKELLEAVRYKYTNVDDIINKISNYEVTKW
jgi:hypothetical protein